MAGGLGCGVYESCTSDDLHYIADTSCADVVVVDSSIRLQKVLEIKDRLNLKAIIQYTGYIEDEDPIIHSWSDVLTYVFT